MPPPPVSASLSAQLLAQAAELPPKRLTRIQHEGRAYVVKMAEIHDSLRLRLMKGNPAAALAREVDLLRRFAARGARVAQVMAASADRVVLADHGPTVARMVRDGRAEPALLRQIGRALAELHALGLAHGRPKLGDICYDAGQITFLDLEAGARLQARPRDQARDLFLLLHSVLATTSGDHATAALVLEGYRVAGDPAVWQATQARAKRLWWLQILARPGAWLHRRRGKTRSEFTAFAATRALIAAQ